MKMIALTCTQCHAPLDVPAGMVSIQCDYCGSSMHITRNSGQSTTESHPSNEPAEIKAVRREIEKLDQEWELYRSQFVRTGEDGEYEVPLFKNMLNPLKNFKHLSFFIPFLFVFALIAGPFLFFFMPVLIFFFVVFKLVKTSQGDFSSGFYKTAQAVYKSKRRQLVEKLNYLKSHQT